MKLFTDPSKKLAFYESIISLPFSMCCIEEFAFLTVAIFIGELKYQILKIFR